MAVYNTSPVGMITGLVAGYGWVPVILLPIFMGQQQLKINPSFTPPQASDEIFRGLLRKNWAVVLRNSVGHFVPFTISHIFSH